MTHYYGAIEAGGTKIVCAVANAHGQWAAKHRFATGTPEQALAELTGFFSQHPIKRLGLASFGPLDINPNSSHYGGLLTTSKPHWGQFPFARALREALQVEVVASTDVLAAALAEYRAGAALGCPHFCYITVGTGIGVGTFIDGTPLVSASHPEAGHLPITPLAHDQFPSLCPYHAHCAEGFASGPALSQRVGRDLREIDASDPLWDLAANYLAQLCHSLNLCYQPQRIVIGGGVAQAPQLLAKIRHAFDQQNTGYAPSLSAEAIVGSSLNNEAGLVGALALVQPLDL